MECNKDEATRAKEIAETKFLANDLVGAKKLALKAQNLYPMLDGVSQLIATLDVYISAQNKINGESDWYEILRVNPQADDETVRKHYRKLALLLHPDKNKSVGADGAFKFISEAWSLLSDKARRVAYDQKRNASKVFQKVSTPSAGSSAGSSANPPAGGANPPAGSSANPPAGSSVNPSTGSSANPHMGSSAKPSVGSSAKPSVGSSATSGSNSNGFHNFTKSSAKAHKSTPRTDHASAHVSSHKSKPNTFWTVCHRCKMQYEYLKVYHNHRLLCPNCNEPFLAVETAAPPSHGTKPWNFSQMRQNVKKHASSKNNLNSGRNNVASSNVGAGGFNGPDSYNQTNSQWGPFSRAGGASSTVQAVNVVQQAYEKVKREREEAQAATKREEALKRKINAIKRMGSVSSSGHSNSAKRKRGMEDVGPSNHGSHATNQIGAGFGGAGMANVSGSNLGNFETGRDNGITKPCSMRDISQCDVQNLLMLKAKTEILMKLKEWHAVAVAKSAAKESERNETVLDRGEDSLANPDASDHCKSGEPLDMENGVHIIKSSSGSSHAKRGAETMESMSINVPDPDFHDFDKDRTERCFGENQVWAAYDNDDGMPRYYAMIHNVISLNPFKMRISWLNSKTNSELGPLNWVGSGFSKTCGAFRVGRSEIYSSLNSFSHKVRWMKGSQGRIGIYPRKGDAWALYRNWSIDWNELTADDVIHKYDMVEVLEDYSEELGVTVTPLVKVAGFKTVFHRHLDPGKVRKIPRQEMFRFSHHVPSYLLTGQEGPNAPKGCRELDPAATPPELLQVIVAIKEEEIVENEENLKEDKVAGGVRKS